MRLGLLLLFVSLIPARLSAVSLNYAWINENTGNGTFTLDIPNNPLTALPFIVDATNVNGGPSVAPLTNFDVWSTVQFSAWYDFGELHGKLRIEDVFQKFLTVEIYDIKPGGLTVADAWSFFAENADLLGLSLVSVNVGVPDAGSTGALLLLGTAGLSFLRFPLSRVSRHSGAPRVI
jgi:hypothetical protein